MRAQRWIDKRWWAMVYDFEWDPNKARSNVAKHEVSFRTAAPVFKDPGMMSIFDEENSLDEDRWITLGMVSTGQILLVIHTFNEISPDEAVIRIISVRKATRSEIQQYQGD
jgi:uncharacterized protein